MLDNPTPETVDARPPAPTAPTTGLFSAQLAQWCDRHRYWLFAGVVLIYLAGYTGQWRIGPDTAIHMDVAQNIAAGQGYTHPTDLHRNVNPGLALLTAATFRIFGSEQLYAINAVMTLLALASLGLTFWLMRIHLDRPTATAVTLLLAATAGLYQSSLEVLTDLPFLVGVLLFLVGYELVQRTSNRVWLGLTMLVAGTAIMAVFRSVVLTFLAAMGVVFIVHIIRSPLRLRFVVASILVLATILVVRMTDPRTGSGNVALRDESKVMATASNPTRSIPRALDNNLPKLISDSLPKALVGLDLGTPTLLVISIISAVGLLALCRKNLTWGLVIGFFILQWLIFTTATRYVLAILPLCALSWWLAVRILESRVNVQWRKAVVLSLLAIWVVPNLVAVGKLTWEQRQPAFWAHYEDGKYQPLIAMGNAIQSHVGLKDAVIGDDANELTYLSSRRVFGPLSLRRRTDRNRTLEQFKNAGQLWVILPMEARLKSKLPPLDIDREHAIAKVDRANGKPLFLCKAKLSQANDLPERVSDAGEGQYAPLPPSTAPAVQVSR